MCYIEDENGQEVPLSVAEYISYSLQDDNISLQSAICQRLLQEAVENAHKPNFQAEQYFISHPDEEIRELALELGPDNVALSKLFNVPESATLSGEEDKQAEGSDLRLEEIVPNLVATYKLSVVKKELQDIIAQMKLPETKADKEKYRQLLAEFTEKNQIVKELAKQCGDRVVLK